MRIKNSKKIQAFSLLEVMIAIFVLVAGLVTLITLMTKSLKVSMESRNQIIAAQLAQEGLELALNLRENRKISGKNYDLINFFIHKDANTLDVNSTVEKGEFPIDYNTLGDTDTLICCLGGLCGGCSADYQRLKFKADLGYQHDSGSGTVFKRIIKIWYPGHRDGDSNYLDFNSCGMGMVAYVYWGDNAYPGPQCKASNKCVVSKIHIDVEKDPSNPLCRNVGASNPLTYP